MTIDDAFAERAKNVIDGGLDDDLRTLRHELIAHKIVAEAATYATKAERFRALQLIDAWIARVNFRRKELRRRDGASEAEQAITKLRSRIRELLPYLRYEGPDPVAWGRFCADITEGSGTKK